MAKTDLGTIDHRAFEAWREVASVDESDPYEVDEARIFAAPDGGFILATATGCSCWDGDYAADRYDTLEELLLDIGPLGTRNGDYNPTFQGVEDLTTQCRAQDLIP